VTCAAFCSRAARLACVVAIAASGCGADDEPHRLAKAISMSGPQPLRQDDHPNDYRYWGNREYIRASRTGWVKLWVSWYDLQQGRPAENRRESWADLRRSPRIKRLDAQIRAANNDSVQTMLTIYQAYPTWANGARGADPLSSKGPERKLPLDLSIDGPWAWFVAFLSDRYEGQLDALEVVNEPNTLYWPIEDAVQATAQMLRTAASVSARWGRQSIIGPATSDTPDPDEAEAGISMDWRSFTSQLLEALTDWDPPVRFHWSQHNYNDVRRGVSADDSRAHETIEMLDDGELWLTEGGYNLGRSWRDADARRLQATRIEQNFDAMRRLPGVAMWTQHGINDIRGNNFKSGLRDDFDYQGPARGRARPAWWTWLGL
jgi:hypothetical protein